MAILAHFEEHAGDERRASARRALRIDLRTNGPRDAEGQVTIHDLSLTGALLQTSEPLAPGEAFEVELPQAGAVEATVVWNSGEFYGCQFKQPISPAALSAALLQSRPRDQGKSVLSGADVVSELRSINEQVEKIAAEVERAVSRLASRKDPDDRK